ncbi:PTS fructose transporter subunit IIABC [Candidatus Arthromitus sp. SFB-rat-Yit]|uniref:PTS fructose transporter subunit IIABC n=1 Tax=Candidatus Arthromitus sp. SFB-rat-Yit TaxID=1041504 RepID=UPI000227A6D5|nr:fructose-specific PTS transporter subunit EIIC [Candidatus Arthromitus sp. SFB-rat-Yit]BAK81108.1 PTS system, IIBC component [Candidatus Arthromitus sp. SFB-rat-Yit]
MRIIDLLDLNSINLNLNSKNKPDVIDELVNLIEKSGNISDKKLYKDEILKRENQSTTGIGEGIAIPHAKTSVVKKACLAAGVSKDGIDYESLDGSNAHLFFMIAAPEGGNNIHLDVLARLSTMLMDEKFRNSLINAKSSGDFLSLIDKMENEKFVDEKDDALNRDLNLPKVLAVTACPTGIAHTFMAAESLTNKAREMGISIKVETNGSSGIKNALTKEEIENCSGIIVAADKKIEMARFNGKRVIQTKVSDGIHKPEELIKRAVSGDAPIYHSENTKSNDTEFEESSGRKIYKSLMNGVSHMLPFVVAGGILIALAFLFDNYEINPENFGSNTPFAAFLKSTGNIAFEFLLPVLAGFIAVGISDRPAMVIGFVGGILAKNSGAGFLGALIAGFIAGYLVILLKKVFSFLPSSLEGIKPVLLYPLFGTLLISIIMVFVFNPPITFINNSLISFLSNLGTSSKILLGVIVAAMMAIDMGGPINKAAYVFGIASIEAGNFYVMAAVMAGGMVPPLVIALATTFFKNNFTKEEVDAGKVNYIMGLSFITEGVIPFAAANPLRVIPSCAIGAAVTGALTMIFDCTLRAPHGGIFVFPIVGNWVMYLISIFIGSIVGALILGALTKNRMTDK